MRVALLVLLVAGCQFDPPWECGCHESIAVEIPRAQHVRVQVGGQSFDTPCPGMGNQVFCGDGRVTVLGQVANVVEVSLDGAPAVRVPVESGPTPVPMDGCHVCVSMVGRL